jgi:tRNA (guanine-N7-)-methyltransferase
MSFGLARGRQLDPGSVGVDPASLPALPDDVHLHPEKARLDPRAWFDHPEQSFELEIGSGKGAFLVAEAAARPETNFLGIEWAREFAEYTADRLRRHQAANVRVLCADATEFLRWRMPDEVCRVIHLYFSDPWPKARHHKRRVVQDAFLGEAHRALEPGGELRIVTDHDDYWAWMGSHFDRWCDPARKGARFDRLPFDATHRAGGAREGELVGTNFERKYVREGRPFHAATLRKPSV